MQNFRKASLSLSLSLRVIVLDLERILFLLLLIAFDSPQRKRGRLYMDVTVADEADLGFTESFETRQGKYLRVKFLAFIGAHELSSPEMWRAAITETVGTAFLMFALFASNIACLNSKVAEPLLMVPFFAFFVIFLLLMAVAPLSGGQMNPTFTFIAALKGVVTLSRATIYILGQFIGAIIGFLLLKSVMSHETIVKYSLAGCTIGGKSGIELGTAFILEFSCTFLACLIGLTVGFDQKRSKELGLPMLCAVLGGSIALPMFISMTVTGKPGYSGAGMNPARCLGPALLHGDSLWDGHWVFWFGSLFASVVYYTISMNFPKKGLSWIEGQYDVSRSCFRVRAESPDIPEIVQGEEACMHN